MNQVSRRAEAGTLAEELLTDIELSRTTGPGLMRKASRLARLLDDVDAMNWLQFEVSGYPKDGPLPPEPWAAAIRSGRTHLSDGQLVADTRHVGAIEASIEAARAILQIPDPSVSVSSANPSQYVMAPASNAAQRVQAIRSLSVDADRLNRVIGSVHGYVVQRYGELRFGAAVESAFEIVRREVDSAIVQLVPDAAPKLAAAYENAASDNPEHWAAASATCRRLLKAAADALRPPGDPVDDRPMTDAHYINRLVDWIRANSESGTRTEMVVSELEDLGRRLDAVQSAGSKGAHDEVSQFDASRFLTGTYLLLGDILRLAPDAVPGSSIAADLVEEPPSEEAPQSSDPETSAAGSDEAAPA